MVDKGHLIAISFVDFYMPVSTICVERLEYGGIARKVDAFVIQSVSVKVLSRHSVYFFITDIELKSAFFFRNEHYVESLFCLGRLDNVLLQYFLYFDFDEFAGLWACSIRSGVYRSRKRIE